MALTQKLEHDEKVRAAAMMVQDDTPSRPNLAGAVVVNSSDPTATYTYYTPDQRPAKLDASGLQNAVSSCEHQYECHSDFDFRVTAMSAARQTGFISALIRSPSLLGLSCQFTLPQTPYDQVKIHEEGHRKIYEYFYRLGPLVAKRHRRIR